MRTTLLASAFAVAVLGVATTGHAAPVDEPDPSEPAATTPASTGAPTDGTSPGTTAPDATSPGATPAATTTTLAPATEPPATEPATPGTSTDVPGAPIRSGAQVQAPTRTGSGGELAPAVEPAADADVRANRGTLVQLTPTLPPPTFDLPANSGTGRRIVYSNSQMRIWAVEEDGTVVKTHRVSGKRYIPGPGTYYVYSRSLHTYAEHNPAIRWMYMVRFAYTPNGGRVGFHEIPTQCNASGCWKLQTEEQLGQALSGGCVRQSTPDAIWVWDWAPVGTKVVVLP